MSTAAQLSAARSASDLLVSAIAIEHKIAVGDLEGTLAVLAEAEEELELTRQRIYEAVRDGRCPDGGTCHHQCRAATLCSRVIDCGPLSGVFPGDRWPEEIRRAWRGE
jgi:hypothetical protein